MPESTVSNDNTVANDCFISDGHLRCNIPHSENQITIPAENIICVLPKHGNLPYNTFLFLENDETSPGSVPQVGRVYLKSVPESILSSYLLTDTPDHLASNLHIIISTASGTGTAKLIFSRTLRPLLKFLDLQHFEVHETKSTKTIIELCHSIFIPRAEVGTKQTIIILAGDGGLCDVIDTFYNASNEVRTMPNIALIPAGTGNAMASSTGLLAHQNAALASLIRGRPAPIPVFAALFSPGAIYLQSHQAQPSSILKPCSLKVYGGVVASWGIHAALVADSDTLEYRKFGADRFKIAAQELLFPSDGSETHKYAGTITMTETDNRGNIEQKVIESEEHMYVLATLVSNLEKKFRISPKSAPLDGSLRMIRFGPMSPERAMQLLSAAYENGQHVGDGDLTYTEIDGFRIDFNEVNSRWRRVCIDGRVVVVDEGGWMEVRKEKKRLLNLLLLESQTA
ncbi:ATP-NAD kinase-like domain-containing protein [Aspergillus karnatakaensis]|uniref:diacylglycerol/lipid kinase family protein n=1 Tax=Aspergillus karnatakaensis TaxID=1810916 RepID=UPI003CCCDB0A